MRTRLDLLVELRFLPASGDRGAPPVIFMIEGHTDPASQPSEHDQYNVSDIKMITNGYSRDD